MLNMTPKEYCIWLQGFLEATGNNLSEAQVQTVKTRLDSIFEHVAEKPKTQAPEEVLPFIPVEPVKPINPHGFGGEVFRC